MIRRVIASLKKAPADIKEYLRPLPDPPNIQPPDLYDPKLWESLHPDDVKFAFKEAILEWKNDWKSESVFVPFFINCRTSHVWR